MKKRQLNLDRLEALLAEHAAKSAPQAERARTAHDGGDQAPLAVDQWPYIQIAGRLEDRIRNGEFGADGKLPATAYLASHYRVSQHIIRHAREELLRRNLVVHRLGEGWFARVPLRLRRADFP